MQLALNRDHPDARLWGCLGVWSLSLTAAVVGMLSGVSEMSGEAHAILGIAMGGLVATWVTMGTWIALIHLHSPASESNPVLADRQNRQSRFVAFSAWIASMLLFMVLAWHQPGMVAQVLLMVAVATMGPWIVWQWTGHRIHRDTAPPRGRRSIRDLLGIAVTIAIGSAALQAGDRWFGLTSASIVMAISTALLWLVMSSIMLTRWWGLAFAALPIVTMPIVAVQWIIIGMMIDMRSADADAELMRLLGTTCGFYFFAVVFLLLMRSGGHRWISAGG